MNIYRVLKRIKLSSTKFLLKHSNNQYKIKVWRKMGAKVGEDCRIRCVSLSPESYLIEIGDNVVIAEDSYLITHEGGVCVFHDERPKLDLFGKIKIGNNTFIGRNCTILPNTTIGKNCIIGAGTVVRGNIADNSVVIGNPGKVVMNTNVYKLLVYKNPGAYDYKGLSDREKKKMLLERLA
jgi:acetyltransferase-like isoleucine patch superfamily enzyme